MAAYFDEKTKAWYIKFRYTDWQGNARTTTRRGFKTKKEAKAAEAKIKEEAVEQPTLTIAELAQIYIADLSQRCKEVSVISARSNFDLHVLPFVGEVSLKDIRPNTIRRWQNSLTGLSDSTVRTINSQFSAMLNYAVKFYGLKQNPFSVAGRSGKSRKRLDFWEYEEFKRALPYMHPRIKVAVEFLFFSGLRVGELLALTPNDINFEKSTVSVSKSLSSITHKITPPKTPSSVRTVVMPSKIIEELKQALSPLNGDLPERVFTIPSSTLRYYFRMAAKEAGVPVITVHGLRHSHASYLIKNNLASIPALAARLGHSSPTITLSTYSHLYKGDDAEIAAELNKII